MTSRIRRLIRASLHTRHLILLSGSVFFLVLAIAFFLVYQNAQIMSEQIEEDFNQQQLILARQVAMQINSTLNGMIQEIQVLGHLLNSNPDPGLLTPALSLFTESAHSKGVVHVTMNECEDGPPSVNGDIPEQSRITIAFKPDVERQDSSVITGNLIVPIVNQGKASSVVKVELDIARMLEAITKNIRSGKTGYAWVIDQDGTFLYHPDSVFIAQNAFSVREKRMPYISFSKINSIMKDQMLRGVEGTGKYVSGWHRGIEGEITKLIAFSPVSSDALGSSQRWSVAVAAPISEVAETVHKVYMRHFATEVLLVAGMFVSGLFVLRHLQEVSHTLEQKMNVQEEYLSNILHDSVDAIIFIDENNRIQVWNRGAELIFGYTAEEMLGRSFRRLIPSEIDAEEELQGIYNQVVKKGYIRNYRTQRITKDGRRITIDLSRTLIKAKDGKVIGSTAIIKDVTEKTEIQNRIYHTEKLASIGILAAGVAHEINNPLAIILGFTDLLIERYSPDSPEYKDLKIIEDSANHAKKVVENMLGFARITEGLDDSIDIPYSIDTVIKIVSNTLMTQKIAIKVDVPNALPRARGDPREFQQVLFNLISNSISAMQGDDKRLGISAEAQGSWVNICVSDNGAGIPDKIMSRIYDPFFTTKKAGEGTGLGLSLCYGILRKCGGRLSCTSSSREDNPERPSGTTFTVSMQVAPPENDKMSAVPAREG